VQCADEKFKLTRDEVTGGWKKLHSERFLKEKGPLRRPRIRWEYSLILKQEVLGRNN
jgi:hypothetical protein